jgi:NTP pyrophosphatase (non-canonical NTP hydrolase)
MVALGASESFDELQRIVDQVYGVPNDRWFDLSDMAANVSRFTMRAIKAVRRGEDERVERNLAVALSWFTSSANRLHMRLSDVTWRRFPYSCATCQGCPCQCGGTGVRQAPSPRKRRPRSIAQIQEMFAEIYPPEHRSLEHAAIHLVEEMGEYQEAILMYRTRHRQVDMRQIETEAADYISCALGLYTSIAHKYGRIGGAASALSTLFAHNCHECSKAPCVCTFDSVMNYNLNDKW